MKIRLFILMAFILVGVFAAGCDLGPTIDTTTTTATTTSTTLSSSTTLPKSLQLLAEYNSPGEDNGAAIAIDSQGRIIIAGYNNIGSNFDMALWRYTANGSTDESFGTHGMVTYNSGLADMATAVMIGPSDSILATGFIFNGTDDDLAVWKYDANGEPDPSFGIGGVATFDSGGIDYGQGIALDHLQNVLVTGYINISSNGNLAVWRFTGSGSLDTSFHGSGLVIYDGGHYDGGYGVIEDSGSGVLVAGMTNNGSNEDMVLLRYNQDGTTDEAFGSGGRAGFDSGRVDYGYSLIRDASGSILVAGSSMLIKNNDMVIWKFSSSGASDESFGSGGRVVYDGGYDNDAAKSIKLDAAGKILTAGYVNYCGTFEAVIWRYNADGTADVNFGQNGNVAYVADQSSVANCLALNSSGEIFSAGNIFGLPSSNLSMALWKFKP